MKNHRRVRVRGRCRGRAHSRVGVVCPSKCTGNGNGGCVCSGTVVPVAVLLFRGWVSWVVSLLSFIINRVDACLTTPKDALYLSHRLGRSARNTFVWRRRQRVVWSGYSSSLIVCVRTPLVVPVCLPTPKKQTLPVSC